MPSARSATNSANRTKMTACRTRSSPRRAPTSLARQPIRTAMTPGSSTANGLTPSCRGPFALATANGYSAFPDTPGAGLNPATGTVIASGAAGSYTPPRRTDPLSRRLPSHGSAEGRRLPVQCRREVQRRWAGPWTPMSATARTSTISIPGIPAIVRCSSTPIPRRPISMTAASPPASSPAPSTPPMPSMWAWPRL